MQQPTRKHFQHAFCYFALGASCLVVSYIIHGLVWAMVYPAMSCLLVAAAYSTNNSSYLHKTAGTYPWCSIILFAPYLAGSWYSWSNYSRKIPAWAEIVPGILLGRRLTEKEAQDLLNQGEIAVLDLAPEISEISVLKKINYKHIPILDLASPSIEQLAEAMDFIQSQSHKMRIFIHCSLGLSRSTAVVAAFLIKQGIDMETAISLIRKFRPEIIVTKDMQQILTTFEENLGLNEQQEGRSSCGSGSYRCGDNQPLAYITYPVGKPDCRYTH